MGNRTVQTDHVNRRTTFTYTPTDQVATRQDGRSRVTTYTYDGVGNETLREYRRRPGDQHLRCAVTKNGAR